MMKFDWVDFGDSWNEPKSSSPMVENLLHKSTASLLAKLLRRRDVPFQKVFCWLRREKGVFERSNTPGVRHIEASFPWAPYAAALEPDRLVLFADWLVETLALGAPELNIDLGEAAVLKQRLSEEHFTYLRTDKLKRAPGDARCTIIYHHTPTKLVIHATCRPSEGEAITRTLEDHPFPRDELVYGRAITRCMLGENGDLALQTYKGVL
jgi:hypothetical protein